MTPRARWILATWAACLVGGGLAAAQPAPSPAADRASEDKVDAKALMQSGVRLLEAKDYLGALAVFRSAYTRFASAKILLNIGTTLNLLDRKADAANAYQQYLDASDADVQKKAEVAAVIAELDKSVGSLVIAVTPADAEIQINDEDWRPAGSVKLHRIPVGPYTVRARRDKFSSQARSAHVGAGERATVQLALAAIPETRPTPGGSIAGTEDAGALSREVEDGGPRSRIGAYLMAHLDLPRAGGAGLVGISADIVDDLTVQGAVILGPTYGAYTGVSYAFLSGSARPFAAVGMPIFFSNGPRMGLRAAGGIELELNRHVSLLAELGLELMLNPEDDIRKLVFIPTVGAIGRL